MPGYVTQDPAHGTVLNGTSTLQCVNGIITNTATPGKAQDTLITGVYIPLAATASTLTVTGFADQTGTARSLLISGQVTIDTNVVFDPPLLNDFAAFTFTPSASNLIVVFTRAFNSGA
jgi:hypothetical protein